MRKEYGLSISNPDERVFKCGLFSCVEFCRSNFDDEDSFEKFEENAKKLYELSEKYNVKVRSLHLPFGEGYYKFAPASLDKKVRDETFENTKRVIEMMLPCGIEIVVIHGSLAVEPDDRAKRLDYFVDYLKGLCDFCAKFNIKVAVETLKPRCLGNGLSEHLYIMENVKRENIGICFDSNHLLEEDNIDFLKAAGKYVITTHLSDFDGIDERHWDPGDGIINWKELIKTLDDNGYNAPYVFEISFYDRERSEEVLKGIIEKWEKLF